MKKGQRDLLLLVTFVAVSALCAKYFFGGKGEDPRHDVPDDVQLCTQHLRALHRALVAYSAQTGSLPEASGTALLGTLFQSGILGDTPENRALLQCPGPGAMPISEPSDWSDPASFGPDQSGYAVRDLAAHPLPHYPTGGDEPFLACNQAGGSNHRGILNVLYADGSVRTFVLSQLIEQGLVPATTTQIEIGPEAVIESLRVFP